MRQVQTERNVEIRRLDDRFDESILPVQFDDAIALQRLERS